MMRNSIIIILLHMSFFSLAQNTKCSEEPIYGKLDFWTGEWEVFDRSGASVGTNRIEKILSECAIMEHWQSSTGQKGKSLFYVDNGSKNWKQVWVTESATLPWGQKEKTLIRSSGDSVLVFQGSYDYNEVRILDRTTLTRISDDEVSQKIEISQDNGANWRATFDAIYRRKNN